MDNRQQATQLRKQAMAALNGGDRATAARLFYEATKLTPDHQESWLWLGRSLDALETKRQAFEHLLTINPNSGAAQQAREELARLQPPSFTQFLQPSAAPPPPNIPPPQASYHPIVTSPSTLPPSQGASPVRKKKGKGSGVATTCLTAAVILFLSLGFALLGIVFLNPTAREEVAREWSILSGAITPTPAQTEAGVAKVANTPVKPSATSEAVEEVAKPTSTVEEPTATPKAPTATPLPASTSKGTSKGKIAFISGASLYLMNPDGSDQVKLADKVLSWGPVWSPDGTKIVFLSQIDNPDGLVYVIKIDGSEEVVLKNIDHLDLAWSPDGSKIVFASGKDRSNGYYQIYTVESDGSNLKKLTNTVKSSNQGPIWSPDGKEIAFISNGQVYVMDANGLLDNEGLEPTKITEGVIYNEKLTWLPDGKRIAAIDFWDVYLIDVDSKKSTKISDVPQPFLSVDGKKVAFTCNFTDEWRGASTEICTINADGSGKTRLTKTKAVNTNPTWSPDGQKIAFISDRDGSSEVYVMNADGSEPTRLTNNTEAESYPVWSPR